MRFNRLVMNILNSGKRTGKHTVGPG